MIITSKSIESFARKEAGGKGFNLYLMTQAGLPVPPWFVVSAECFRKFKIETQLEDKIQSILNSDLSDSQASDQISQLICNSPVPASVEELIKKAWSKFEGLEVAVRSSALDEDSAQHSFAGQLSTFLYVSGWKNVLKAILACWASAFSERSLSYRRENHLELSSKIEVAVVIQEMVNSEKSGVLFTCDPIHRDSRKIMINSVYGIGEGIVSGLLDADLWVLDKKTGKVDRSEVADKLIQLKRSGKDQSGSLEEVLVPVEFQKKPSLVNSELEQLREMSNRVENFYRFPQDVEWAFSNQKVYLLQSRPVTTPVDSSEGYLNVWDNSNIVESYGGITLPLTFTFARFVYHQVYVQFCEILMVPQKEIRNMDFFLRNMLGSSYGRIYYNILNWYKLTSILPGFKYNRGFMETMMGTSHQLEDEIADRIKPPGFQEKLSSKIRRFMTGLKFFWYHLTIQKMVDSFLANFSQVYSQFRKIDYSRKPSDEIFRTFQELERQILGEWKAPIINDYLTMVHFGLLKKLTESWLPEHGSSLANDLLCGDGNLESAEPTRQLIRLAREASETPELMNLLLDTPASHLMEVLSGSSYSSFFRKIEDYIDRFGFRCMSEMKLEQRDLYQDPSFLFICLKNYLRSGTTDLETYEKNEKAVRQQAEGKVRKSLKGLKKWIYLWSLKNARQAVRNRENTRFCRTRIYGVVRSMFYGIGNDFALRGIIEKPADIFYIELNELAGTMDGHLTVQSLKELIELRKREYQSYEDFEPATRFMTRGPVYWGNSHSSEEEQSILPVIEDLPPHAIQGTGACPGVVEGKVKVILSPDDDMQLDGEILVTLRTDPGWVPLFPSASALLVERGGLLSHSAIVAREMGIPTVVGVKGLTQKIKNGMRVRLNGQTGVIEILDQEEIA